MTRERAHRILQILRGSFSLPSWVGSGRRPFETLVRTVLSQNTADVNTERAYRRLSERFPITPEALAEADLGEIEGAIRVAGLYRNKSKVIKSLARLTLERFDGSLSFIHSTPLEDARKTLLGMPGVGPKTADILLLFCAGRPTLPVDTHVHRVSKRLGLAPPGADYEGVRLALQALYPPEEYLPAHLLLIALGRRYCKARRPLCGPCPVNRLCPSRSPGDSTVSGGPSVPQPAGKVFEPRPPPV